MNRATMRGFIALSTVLTFSTVKGQAAEPKVPAKPNFIFVISDDHRWDAMGVVQREHGDKARYPWFETPAMDRMAAEGVRFRNAFVTHSICSPGRAGFLTGQYTHVNGIMDNDTPFPATAITHATLLRDAGYQTAYFGKWHMGPQKGQRPGFQYSASFHNQGIYTNCPFEINGVMTPTTGWVDDVSTDMAITWLREHKAKPFSMVVGFKSPHNKRGAERLPDRLRHLYEGKTTRPTPNVAIAAVYHKPLTAEDAGKPRGLSDNEVHLDYLRHIKGADENLGRLLAALDELKIADDTVIVYSSDNGYFLGERGLGDKRALYEEGLRLPFLVRYPRLFPKCKCVDQMVLNIDLAPTFLDLAGLPVHPGMHGKSFKDLACGNTPANWRTSFLAYYRKELGDTPTCYGVRTTEAKMIVYPNNPEWNEVYNLAVDPYEMKNLVKDDPVLTSKLMVELDAQMKAVNYKPPRMRAVTPVQK
jgi:arylsulfatase A-like enzyme